MTPEIVVGLFVVAGLTLYLLFGGADFGAGIWELLLVREPVQQRRELVNRTIGPIWETNHVWLVFVVVVVHSAFPRAYAALFQALLVPLLFALVGIVLRGSAFALRSHAQGEIRLENVWSAIFVGASALTPFFIGASIGAVAAGVLDVTPQGQFQGSFLAGWVSWLAIYMGFFTVGLCVYLAAAYLAREEGRDAANRSGAWRKRSMLTGVAVGAMAMIGLAVIESTSPALREGLQERAWPLIVVSFISGWASLAALWKRRFSLAVVGAGGAVATVVWAWAVAQYPWIIPSVMTLQDAKASDTVLRLIAWSLAIGTLLLSPALIWLYYLYKGRSPASTTH